MLHSEDAYNPRGPSPDVTLADMSPTALAVYIADDSAPIAEMLTELLADGARVRVVGTGATQDAALGDIRRLAPDVVVLDLQLASGSGTEVIRAVRGDAGLAGVRLLVTSNHDSPQLRAGCLALGADGYFDKVKELGALVERVQALARDKEKAAG